MTPEGGIVMDDRIADMSPRNEEGNGDSPITVRTTMKPHVGSRMIAAAVAMGTAFALIAPSSALAADATPAAASTGTTYYVSSTHGDDGNAGTDQGHPWKTLDKVNAIATDLKPGDSVLLERGSTFQDSICTSRTRREPPTRPSPSPITATPPPSRSSRRTASRAAGGTRTTVRRSATTRTRAPSPRPSCSRTCRTSR